MGDVSSDSCGRNRFGRGAGTMGMGTPTIVASKDNRERNRFSTRLSCFKTLYTTLSKQLTTFQQDYSEDINYTNTYNSWLMAVGFMYSATTTKAWDEDLPREIYHTHTKILRWATDEGPIEIIVIGHGRTKRLADNHACFQVLRNVWRMIPIAQMGWSTESNQTSDFWENFNIERMRNRRKPCVQMETPEKTTEQGDATQESVKSSNTIITRDQQETVQDPVRALDTMTPIATSEPTHDFKTITNRWMPLENVTVTADKKFNEVLATFYLPEAIYKANCSPNLIPFETFVYGRLSIELRIVVNANKFSCGKIVMSSKYDSYQADEVSIGTQSALARNHVIIDLCANNEGELQIPFRFHRPLARLVRSDNASGGVRAGKYATAYIHMLSPLQTGPGGPSDISLTVFYKLQEAVFGGMTYRATVQTLGLEDIVTPKTSRALKEVLAGAERAFDQLGKSENQDKPGIIGATPVIPRPRLNFATGKGVTDVVPLRINPHTLTNYKAINIPQDEPKSFYDLARIWGIYKAFTWKKTDSTGAELASIIIDPSSRSYTQGHSGEPTPLEYAMDNFAFWSGPIELRFDFVSNAYHTGTVQISAEFGRATASADACQSQSTYTKTFHLGDQKSVVFVVPYIYDTIMRRTTSIMGNPYQKVTSSDALSKRGLTIAPLSRTVVKVRVVNGLRPIASAPQSIEVLVFVRAGRNFNFHGLKGRAWMRKNPAEPIDKFPLDYPGRPEDEQKRTKRSAEDKKEISKYIADQVASGRLLPRDKANVWNEYKPECLPTIQMDTGDKETLDPTDNFQQGISRFGINTLDSHLNFKDLLRRPVLLQWNVTINPAAGTSAWYLPLQPPTRSFCAGDEVFVKTGPYCSTLGTTTTVGILDMFRLWRGSMRYTIVCTTANAKPFYVSLLPHTGVRIYGDHDQLEATDPPTDLEWPMAGTNIITELVVPGVNPTICIEAPYDTENTWTYLWDTDPRRNYTWRDKGDSNSGHLVITTHEAITCDIWWAAGDDFEIANFYGMPHMFFNSAAYRLTDAPVVQMDFRPKETLTRVGGLISNVCTLPNLGRAAIASLPVVGMPLLAADTVGRTLDQVKSTQENIDIALQKTGHTLGKIDMILDGLNGAQHTITDIISAAVSEAGKMFGNIISSTTLIFDVLLDILTAWMERSWRIVAVAVVRFVAKIFCVNLSDISAFMGYVTQIHTWLIGMVSQQTPQVQIDTETPTIVGIICGLVGTLAGVAIDPWRDSSTSALRSLAHRLTTTTGVAYLINVLRFVQGIFEVVKTAIMRMLGYVSPEARALKMLSEHSSEINKFVIEAQMMTSEANMVCLNHPDYRRKFWYTVLQAHKIQRIISQVPTNAVSSQLAQLCSAVVKCGNERFMDVSACPVRFEPMVICIEGSPGIGKSFMTEQLVQILLQKVSVTPYATESIFYRTAGERFWSGYRNQPVVVYDEWLNTTDPIRCNDQIAEMMKLKSTAIFVPEMAHLEEKKMRANPLIIIVLCNNAFPNNLGDYCTNVKATLRRRDVVLRMRLKEEYSHLDYRNMDEDTRRLVDKWEHVEFQKYRDVKDPKSLNNIVKDHATTVEWLGKMWQNYHRVEVRNVKTRMERLPQYMQAAADYGTLRDPFTIFYQVNHEITADGVAQNAWTPYEQLEAAVTMVSQALAAPEPPEQPLEPLVPWELAQPPSTQIDIGQVVAGIAYTATIPAMIARATRQQLLLWENSLNPIRTEQGECYICKEECGLAFVCKATRDRAELEGKHMLCLTCFTSLKQYGSGICGMCRCPDIEPLYSTEDLSHLSIWARLAVWTNRGAQWLCDKILTYYGWRHSRPFESTIIDWLVTTANLLVENRHLIGVEGAEMVIPAGNFITHWDRLFHMGRLMYSMWGSPSLEVQIQGDEWDDEEPTTSYSVMDRFRPEINMDVIDDWFLHSQPQPFCMHHLLSTGMGTIRLTQDGWLVPDVSGWIKVPLTMCEENCAIRDVLCYKNLVENYVAYHKSDIRQSYIALYNDPSEAMFESISPLFRPSWYKPLPQVVTENWWEWLTGKFSQYKTTIAYLLGATAAVAAMVKIYDLATRVTSTVVQSSTTGSAELSPRHLRRTIERRGGRHTYFQSEYVAPDILEVVMGYIAKNTFQLILSYAGKEHVMYGTGLFNHYLLIPRHYAREIKRRVIEGAILSGFPLMSPQTRAEITIGKDTFVESPDSDIAYMLLPSKYPLFKDLRKFIAVDEDLDKPLPSTGILLGNPKTGATFMREIEVDIFGLQEDQTIVDQDGKGFTVKEVVVYSYSRPGSCGSLLLRENHQRPIISMHIAGVGSGVTGEGYGVPLTKELLGNLTAMQGVPVQFADVEYQSVENMSMDFGMDTFLTYYGSVPKEEVPYIPTKSKLRKSEIYGAPELLSTLEPAILDKKDPRYIHDTTPLWEGVRKHGKPTLDFDPQLIDKVGEAYWESWIQHLKPLVAEPKLLTDEEAILGLDYPYYTPMDLKTSAGYPYSLDKKRTTKEAYITVGRDKQLKPVSVGSIDPQLRNILDQKRELRKRGIVPHTLFIDTLKDEKRKTEKARALGGTRVFCSSPMDYVIECRRWFLHFTAAFMEQRFNVMSAVGIDPTSSEWSRLTKKLLKQNSKWCTIDYTNFGAGFNSEVARKAYELMIRWVTMHVKEAQGREQEMWCIIYECLQSMHICNNVIYQQGTGSPSGAFFTTIINTMVNHLYILIAWEVLVGKILKQTLKLSIPEFKKKVALFCYGDDGIFSVAEEYVGIFNMKTITDFFSDYGIVATDANKTKDIQPIQSVSECSFLKRGFKPHPYRETEWLSPLEMNSIKGITQWVWKSPNNREATTINAHAALLQLHGHGPEVFGKYKQIINNYLMKAKCSTVAVDWGEIDHKFYTIGLDFNVENYLYGNIS